MNCAQKSINNAQQNTASETDTCSAYQDIPTSYGTQGFISKLCAQQLLTVCYS
jgi:hypothetical protein